MLFDLLFQPFCWLLFSHWTTNSVNCGRASHTNEKQGTAALFASQKPGCLQWFQTQPSSSRASPCITRTERKSSQTIENKPVTISGDPSKPPNDNTKTKLKNNSTTTMQEACGRASTTSQVLKGTNQLPDDLNTFYARFEADKTAHTESAPAAAAEEVSPLSLSVTDVTRSSKRVNIRKTVDPDSIPGRVLQACTFQLAGVFKDIFNLSLSLSVVPACFKKSTIVPIPKKNKITCLNDWRAIALTPIFSKCFEKLVYSFQMYLVRDYICSVLPASLDPLQFAYRSNRSTDDAIAFTLHTALSHLEKKNTYMRMLFVDYSSAFNTIVPATLVAKLQTLGLNKSLCSWILDFLTGRSQLVKIGNNTSSPLVLNNGAPQGCILSPLLYSLYTQDCTATSSNLPMTQQ